VCPCARPHHFPPVAAAGLATAHSRLWPSSFSEGWNATTSRQPGGPAAPDPRLPAAPDSRAISCRRLLPQRRGACPARLSGSFGARAGLDKALSCLSPGRSCAASGSRVPRYPRPVNAHATTKRGGRGPRAPTAFPPGAAARRGIMEEVPCKKMFRHSKASRANRIRENVT
jgi:hypothetical protein